MSTFLRRSFLKRSVTYGGAAAVGWRPFARALGANEDIRAAVVGFRGKGAQHISMLEGIKGVRVVGLCDADRSVLDRKIREFEKKNQQVAAYLDVRELLADDNIDVVSTATPNHWHALVAVWGCQAGKDVYVEKPGSHCVWEGRKMLEAALKYKRIVQHGTQSRSDTGLQEAVQWIREGNLGKPILARGLCYKGRGSIGKVDGPQPIPESIDYDLWTGPRQVKPLMRRCLHYDWHWFWDTGNGDIGNQGIHEMDVCRWFAGHDTVSPRVISVGGRFGYDDDGETPNTQFVFHDYDEFPVLFEVRGLPEKSGVRAMPHYKGVRVGNVIHCEGGYVAGGWAYDKDGKRMRQFKRTGAGNHMSNFIAAVRSRKQSDLNAFVREAHPSCALVHTGNISHRLGQLHSPDEVMESIKGEPLAIETFERMKEHLAANGVDISKTPPVLGPWLQMDPQAERFTGAFAEEANALLKDDYRDPFVIPEKV